MNNKIKHLESLYDKNKLSHAILIETNNQNFCIDELSSLVKKMSCLNEFKSECDSCNNCKMIDRKQSLNFFVIEPDGKNIKKEQIQNLKEKCSIKPVLSKNNVYIIKNSETLNSSSANTMLKFIEEPYDNCFGFFVTNSKDNVINTIRSRCEIYTIKYKDSNFIENFNITKDDYEDILNSLKIYLKDLELNKSLLINKDKIDKKFKTKENIQSYFRVILEIYNYYIKIKINAKNIENKYTEFNYINENQIESLLKKKEIIISLLNNMSYNLNIDLMLDKFVIEMGELK